MQKHFFFLVTSFFIIFFSGCATHVKIKALKPAEIDRATTTKNIAVVTFKHDRVALSSKIESNLASYKIENKPFFTMVSRSDLNQVIKEQKLQNSGLVDTKDIVEVGELIGAQAIISGNVGRSSLNDTHYYENRVGCSDKKCKKTYIYRVRCTKRVISLSADIKMVDVTRGDIIYADNMSRSSTYRHCRDDSRALPSKESVAQNLATSIANSFTYKLTPHYRYFSVELLDKPDLDYTDEQEDLLENALKYMEHKRYDRAESLLTNLVESTDQQSYVAFYNLGVVKETQGDYKKAKLYYERADNLTEKPVEAVSIAYNRIKAVIEESHIISQQMSR
ncbi:MAG: tetratricopeptide (TPR) repeat protein [Sulfurimonas sp.]|jgi:tetratricopeptide (TPR) repeat protein|uniref:CsgG/HfaB family protein n=1 Tax=Sulfurimonas sp. TaxID=2022749 RepID=UPI0039E4F48F